MVLDFKKDDDCEHNLRHVHTEAVWTDKLILVPELRVNNCGEDSHQGSLFSPQC